MRRPNKPHIDGYEAEEDCEGYYDPDEVDRRGCHNIMQRNPNDPCEICFNKWQVEEDARRKTEYDALTDEEKEQRAKFLEELRKLY